jgi:hypothetical protein
MITVGSYVFDDTYPGEELYVMEIHPRLQMALLRDESGLELGWAEISGLRLAE